MAPKDNFSQPTSERCLNCRRRKVKCDKSKPTCGHCKRLQLRCDWSMECRFKDLSTKMAKKHRVSQDLKDRARWSTGEPLPASFPSDERNQSLQSSDCHSVTMKISTQAHSGGSQESHNYLTGTVRCAATPLPQAIDPAPVSRVQMLTVAIYHYLPSEELNRRCRKLEQWPTLTYMNPQNSALFCSRAPLSTAVETFSLAQAAVSLKDPSLSVASIRRYSDCLASLKIAINHAAGYPEDELLLCILVLQAVEIMRPTSQSGGWFSHVKGAMKLVEDRGPRTISNRYGTVLFQHVRQGAILWGMSTRQKIPFDSPPWISMSVCAPMTSPETRLLDLGISLPNLLAIGDQFRARNHDNEVERESYWHVLSAAFQQITTWVETYIIDKAVITKTCDPCCFGSFLEAIDSFPFEEAFLCQSFNDAWYLSMAWTFLFAVQKAQMSMLSLPLHPVEGRAELNRSMDVTASQLCMTIPQFFNPSFGFLGRASINLFLQLLLSYFETRCDERMVKFCRDVEDSLEKSRFGHVVVSVNG